MEKVINLRLPHIGEQIFENIDTDGLIQLLEVSTTWKILAENVLLKRWKGKIMEACTNQRTEIVKLLLDRCQSIWRSGNIRRGAPGALRADLPERRSDSAPG